MADGRAGGKRLEILDEQHAQPIHHRGQVLGAQAGPHLVGLLGAVIDEFEAQAIEAGGLSGEVARADLVVCATPRVDWAAMAGSVVSHAAQVAAEYAVPAVAISPVVQVGRRELMAMGLSGSYQVAGSGAVGWRERAAQVAVTWSRRRG